MDAEAHRASLQRDAAALAAAARKDLAVPIPSCPGWCMADLVWHTGTAVQWADRRIRRHAALIDADTPITVEAPPDDQLVDWLEEGAARLLVTLAEVDPDDTLGKDWIEPGYPGPSLARHYAREVGVHRWDAEKACGAATPLDDDLASDWLDGILTTWLPRASSQGRQAQGDWSGQRVLFRRCDGPQRWLVTLRGPGAVEISRDEAHADVVAEGNGAALLLLAMNRIPSSDPSLVVQGEREIFARWAAEIRYGRPAGGAHALGSPRPSARNANRPGT